MPFPALDKISGAIRRAAYTLSAALAGLIAVAFLTAGGFLYLSQVYGSVTACLVTGGVYLALAGLVLVLKPRLREPHADKVTIGLALGSSFAQGFAAGRDVRR